MLITYRVGENENKGVGFKDGLDPKKDKGRIVRECAISLGRIKDLEKELAEEKEKYENLVKLRYQVYKHEKIKDLEEEFNGTIPNKKNLIQKFYSEGKCYDEIALMTGASKDYIYKVVCNYKKRKGIKDLKSDKTELEIMIIQLALYEKTINEIVASLGCSRQYVYKVLKDNNITSYKRSKKGKVVYK